MRNKKKLFNDPIYGLIQFDYPILYDLIEHPYFQRLRRISQLGLSDYVYPGAKHSRFQHALGALHLMHKAIVSLERKGVEISTEEKEAAAIAILLHDIGHGPFSHVLEHTILEDSHETLSLQIMHILNEEFDGKLDLAIKIFSHDYEKSFLSQLVSGALDVDRLDYLTRDSFFTGVAEGVIGYDRILHMINVHNNKLVVEEKGVFSIENFLMARQMMYHQVYLHKTVISIDQMLISFLQRYKDLHYLGIIKENHNFADLFDLLSQKLSVLEKFLTLDDIDIYYLLKRSTESKDQILKYLAKCIVNRDIFSIFLFENDVPSDFVEERRQMIGKELSLKLEETKFLVLTGKEKIDTGISKDEICIINKSEKVKPVSDYLINDWEDHSVIKHFICYPKSLVG